MSDPKRKPWQRYVDDLLMTPRGSASYLIGLEVSGMSSQLDILAYLGEQMACHNENERVHEICWELRALMTGGRS